jgi:ribosomal protein S18 acetylase RimI-like enzyme
MTANIRPMAAKDKSAVMEILQHTPEFKPAEVVVAEEVIDGYLCDPTGSGYHVIVAEDGGYIVGYLAYGPTPLTEGTWDFYWAAVVPQKRGRGIGKSLLAFAEREIVEARGRLALIETSSKPEYENTRRFHQSQGYEVACRIPDFYSPGDDKVIFVKRLC